MTYNQRGSNQREVRNSSPDDPTTHDFSTRNEADRDYTDVSQQSNDPTVKREIWVVNSKSNGSSVVKWILGLAAFVLIIMAVSWASGIASTLHGVQQTANQNSAALAHQSAQLSGIQASLNSIGAQLSRMQREIQTFFATILNALHAK